MSVTQDYKTVATEIMRTLGDDHYATLLDALLTRREYLNKMIMADGKFPGWHEEQRRLYSLLDAIGQSSLRS